MHTEKLHAWLESIVAQWEVALAQITVGDDIAPLVERFDDEFKTLGTVDAGSDRHMIRGMVVERDAIAPFVARIDAMHAWLHPRVDLPDATHRVSLEFLATVEDDENEFLTHEALVEAWDGTSEPTDLAELVLDLDELTLPLVEGRAQCGLHPDGGLRVWMHLWVASDAEPTDDDVERLVRFAERIREGAWGSNSEFVNDDDEMPSGVLHIDLSPTSYSIGTVDVTDEPDASIEP